MRIIVVVMEEACFVRKYKRVWVSPFAVALSARRFAPQPISPPNTAMSEASRERGWDEE